METPNSDTTRNTKMATFAILLATILWGSTFIIIKLGIQTFPPFSFQGLRHLMGLFLLLPFIRNLKTTTKFSVFAGISMGIAVTLMIVSQTIALKTADAGKGSFIFALYVPFTPFFARYFLKSKILVKHWISILFAITGLIILVFGQYGFDLLAAPMVIGDFLMFLGAIIAAFQIVLTEYFVKQVKIFDFVFFSMSTTTITLFGLSLITKEQLPLEILTPSIWLAILYLGFFTTCLPGFIQAYAQKHISSTRAALIYSMEPVFATLFAVFFGNELLNWMFFIGAALILTGVLLSSISKSNG
jgi:drug/metabolite transporter (DMT)-like permease